MFNETSHPRLSPHYFIQQGLVAVNHIINNIALAYCLEMLPSTMNLRFFNQSQLHGVHRALCFCHKIDVLDIAFIECNCPVRVVVANRCGNGETLPSVFLGAHKLV